MMRSLLEILGGFALGWFGYRAWIEVTGRLAIRRWHALEAQQRGQCELPHGPSQIELPYGPSKAEREARVVRAEHGATWNVPAEQCLTDLDALDAFHRLAGLPRRGLVP